MFSKGITNVEQVLSKMARTVAQPQYCNLYKQNLSCKDTYCRYRTAWPYADGEQDLLKPSSQQVAKSVFLWKFLFYIPIIRTLLSS